MASMTPDWATRPAWKERREGQLKRLKSKSIIRELVFYDTETFQAVQEDGEIVFPFRLGYATHITLDDRYTIKKRHDKELWKEEDFIDFILSKLHPKKTLYIFAHNQGFDTRVLKLPFYFKDLGYEVELPIINMRTFIWKVKTPKGNITFLDTANYAVHTVDALGYDMGYPKLKVDFSKVSDRELMTYCARDVEIIEKFILSLLEFIDVHKLGSFRNTLASLALSAYRTRFMDRPPHIHTNQAALNLERKAYYGGRTEAWFIGCKTNQEFYAVDVNSMYPAVMTRTDLPVRLAAHIVRPKISELESYLTNFYTIAKVKLITDEPVYPLKDKGKLLFPIGEFVTYLSHPELIYALSHDHVIQIYELVLYYKAPVFKEFIDYFYNLRLEYTEQGNSSWRFITKIFLNSLYGKFAQQEPIRILIGQDENNLFAITHGMNYEQGFSFKETTWFGDIYLEYKQGETTFSFPGLSAAITSHARMLLWEYILTAGKGNVYYMDTDSLIVNKAGVDNLREHINSTQLGKLKIEAQSSRLLIYGAKDYRMTGKKAHKGLRNDAQRITKDQWNQIQFKSFMSWLNRMEHLEPSARIRPKRRLHNYTKGRKQLDGRVIPHLYKTQNGVNHQQDF